MKMVLEFYFEMFPVYCKCMYLLGSTCEFSDIYMKKDGLRDAARKDSEGAPCWSRWTDVSHCYLKWLTCHVEKKKLFQPYTLHTVDKLLKHNRGITHSWKVCVGICSKKHPFSYVFFGFATQEPNSLGKTVRSSEPTPDFEHRLVERCCWRICTHCISMWCSGRIDADFGLKMR